MRKNSTQNLSQAFLHTLTDCRIYFLNLKAQITSTSHQVHSLKTESKQKQKNKNDFFVLNVHCHKSLSSCRLSLCQAWALIPPPSLRPCWTSSSRQIWPCHILGCSCQQSQTCHLSSRQKLDRAQKRRNTNSPAAPRQAVINLHVQAKALVLNIYSICIQIRIPNKSTVGAKARAKKLFFSF